MNKIENTVALVTGGNRGIGKALVEELLAGGARRIYVGTRDLSAVDELSKAHGERVVPLLLDVTDRVHVERASARAGDVRLLINNAGLALPVASEIDTEKLLELGRKEMEVNLFGTLSVTRAFAPILGANGGGAVVNIVSVAGLVNFPSFFTYSLSKASLHSLTQGFRTLLAPQGTLVVGVYPGPVETEMARTIELPKTPARDVAKAILDGVEAGLEEILPDPMAKQIGEAYFQNPKALEKRFAGVEG